MSHSRILLLLLTAVLLGEKCFHAWDINHGNGAIKVRVVENADDVDLQMLDDVGKRSSLFYAVTNDCVPRGSFCRYPYGAYYSCCPDNGCFCNLLGFCMCKSYDDFSNDDLDSTAAGTTNPIRN